MLVDSHGRDADRAPPSLRMDSTITAYAYPAERERNQRPPQIPIMMARKVITHIHLNNVYKKVLSVN